MSDDRDALKAAHDRAPHVIARLRELEGDPSFFELLDAADSARAAGEPALVSYLVGLALEYQLGYDERSMTELLELSTQLVRESYAAGGEDFEGILGPMAHCYLKLHLQITEAIDDRGYTSATIAAIDDYLLRQRPPERCRHCYLGIKAKALAASGRLQDAETLLVGLLDHPACEDRRLSHLLGLTEVMLLLGRTQDAQAYFKRTATVPHSETADRREVVLHRVLLLIAAGDLEDALALARRERPILQPWTRAAIRISLELAGALGSKGRWGEAESLLGNALQWSEKRNLLRTHAQALLFGVKCARANGDTDLSEARLGALPPVLAQLRSDDLHGRFEALVKESSPPVSHG